MQQARSTHRSWLRAAGLLLGLWGTACERAPTQPPQPPPPRGPTCEADECNALGMAAVARARHAEAIELLDRSCTLGHAVGCSNLAGLMRGGAGGLGEPSRAVNLYDRSCTLGFAEACSAVGSIYAEGKLVAADLTRARAMYDQACAHRDAYGCFTAGMFASEGRGGVRSPEAAGERFDQACALGHATACFNAGVLLYRERGARPGENERAAVYFKRACDGQQPAGCLRLGIATLHGHGLVADPQLARDLFDRACTGGEADGCAAARQLAGARKGRSDLAIALTSSAPTLAMHGLRVHELECRMPEVGPMALAEVVEAIAAHKAALDACAPRGAAPAVAWTWKGRRAAQVQVRGGGPKVEACVRKAVERTRAELSGECAAFVLVGDPEGAQRMLLEQRSAGISSPALAARTAAAGKPEPLRGQSRDAGRAPGSSAAD
jgi:TPR repeat protein